MEKFTSIDRVVGLDDDLADELLGTYEEIFNDQKFEELKGKERPKTSDEKELIGVANSLTNEVRTKFGLEEFDIPENNIHVIKDSEYPKDTARAIYSWLRQGIMMREAPANVQFVKSALHEMVHMKSHNAIQMTLAEKPDIETYRMGLCIITRDGTSMYLNDLNEAITEELAIRLMDRLRDHPLVKADIARSKIFIRDHEDELVRNGKSLISPETIYVDRFDGEIFQCSFGYKKERKVLNLLINKIFKGNADKFADREAVFEMFAKAMITGKILELGRIIIRSFGEETFRNIAVLDGNLGAQEEFIKSL